MNEPTLSKRVWKKIKQNLRMALELEGFLKKNF